MIMMASFDESNLVEFAWAPLPPTYGYPYCGDYEPNLFNNNQVNEPQCSAGTGTGSPWVSLPEHAPVPYRASTSGLPPTGTPYPPQSGAGTRSLPAVPRVSASGLPPLAPQATMEDAPRPARRHRRAHHVISTPSNLNFCAKDLTLLV